MRENLSETLPKTRSVTVDLGLTVLEQRETPKKTPREAFVDFEAGIMVDLFRKKTNGQLVQEVAIYSDLTFANAKKYDPKVEPMDIILKFYQLNRQALEAYIVTSPEIKKTKDRWEITQKFKLKKQSKGRIA